MKNLLLTTVLMLAVIFSSNATNNVNGPAKKVSISGAGATFPLPFYNLAFKTYQDKTGNSITYGGIGSGGGIRSLKTKSWISEAPTPICPTKKWAKCPRP